MPVRRECLDKTAEERKDCHQGQGCCVYELPDTRNYSEQEDHKQRSIAHQPQHLEHWKKAEHKLKVYTKL